jgi:hypothetical protein
MNRQSFVSFVSMIIVALWALACAQQAEPLSTSAPPSPTAHAYETPVIQSVSIPGRGDSTMLRQGSTGARVVVKGLHLTGVRSATLVPDVSVDASPLAMTVVATDAETAVLQVDIPHGMTLGRYTLEVSAGGLADSVADVLTPHHHRDPRRRSAGR